MQNIKKLTPVASSTSYRKLQVGGAAYDHAEKADKLLRRGDDFQ